MIKRKLTNLMGVLLLTTTAYGSEVKSDNSSVDDLPLPTRTINALKKHGINSLSDLRTKSDEEISDIKNLGEKSIEEIKKLLGR